MFFILERPRSYNHPRDESPDSYFYDGVDMVRQDNDCHYSFRAERKKKNQLNKYLV